MLDTVRFYVGCLDFKGKSYRAFNIMAHASHILTRINKALADIGYGKGFIKRNYTHAVFPGDAFSTKIIPLACFAQQPPSYRNACIGVIIKGKEPSAKEVNSHRALGAPLIFEIDHGELHRWSIRAVNDVELLESVPHNKIEGLFRAHKKEWNPTRIFRAKALHNREEATQLDFFDIGYFPLLESLIKDKLDKLLRKSLRETKAQYRKAYRKNPNTIDLYRLIFRLVAAKILKDRNQVGNWNSDDPIEVLDAVEEYYNTEDKLLRSKIRHKGTIEVAWNQISGPLHFQNLSADDLAFVYENTLITPETRKTYGTHSTPTEIAEYIVRNLPFEMIDSNDRHILEPCSGHGAFLISAMRRMKELLPAGMSNSRRHKYFQERLVGIEIDSFAIEICRLALMLADYPNPNGWKLYNEDIFQSDRLKQELNNAECVLCNPPFENFPSSAKGKYKRLQSTHQPEELLLRILSNPPSLLGFVLPKSFLTAAAYKRARRKVIETYRETEIIILPDSMFTHSDAEPVLLLAKHRAKNGEDVTLASRTVTKSEQIKFLKEGFVPDARTINLSPKERRGNISFNIQSIHKLWLHLSDYPTFGSLTEIHRGVEYKIPLDPNTIEKGLAKLQKKKAKQIASRNYNRVFSKKKKKNFEKGVHKAKGTIQQYLLAKTTYLRIHNSYMRGNAHEFEWKRPKILANYIRLSRGPWRIAGVEDTEGLFAYVNVYGIWPNKPEDTLPLLAIINSPIANAYLFNYAVGRHNSKYVLQQIPIPKFMKNQKSILRKKVTLLQNQGKEIANKLMPDNLHKFKHALLQVDAELLKFYDLPPKLERELLDTFKDHIRPVPFVDFTDYYPEGFNAFLPLHRVISKEFEYARADRLLKRLKPIKDIIVHEAFELAEGDED